MTLRGQESTLIAFEEEGNRRGGEEHASPGSSSTERGDRGRHPPKRYETFASDNDWVQHVRCSLLGLEAGTMPTRKDIATLERFVPRAAASESDLPEVITDHWLPILREEGLLVECSPDQFTAMVDWVPLYT